MSRTPQHTYTVLKGTKTGLLIEMDIPADAVQLPRETQAAFHRRVATSVRVSKPLMPHRSTAGREQL